jgi:hypothetical protein
MPLLTTPQVWTVLNSQFIATKSAAIGTAVIPMLFVFFFHQREQKPRLSLAWVLYRQGKG